VPLEQVESLDMNAPKTPRDVILIPAQLAVKDGPAGDIFLPGLYAGSFAATDDAVRLGRATDWLGADGEPLRGAGAKYFLLGDTGERGASLLDWRSLEIN
jgi:type VI secretion system protein ImpE